VCFAEFAGVDNTLNETNKQAGSQLLGTTQDGTYDCNYTAVYHLMSHDDHMMPEDLFQYTLVWWLQLLAIQILSAACYCPCGLSVSVCLYTVSVCVPVDCVFVCVCSCRLCVCLCMCVLSVSLSLFL